jgi:hypothetical protein
MALAGRHSHHRFALLDAASFMVGEVGDLLASGQGIFCEERWGDERVEREEDWHAPKRHYRLPEHQLVESHYTHWAAETLLSLARNLRRPLGGVHAESRGEHCCSVPASSTAKLQDVGLGWQHSQKRLEEAAAPIGAARRISWSLRRVEPQSNSIEWRVVGRQAWSARHVWSPCAGTIRQRRGAPPRRPNGRPLRR